MKVIASVVLCSCIPLSSDVATCLFIPTYKMLPNIAKLSFFSKIQNRRLLENVRYLNVKGSDTTSGRTSPCSTWSLASDERSECLFDSKFMTICKLCIYDIAFQVNLVF